MHIKDSPVKGYKTDFAGFELDTSAIELHSAHKREILLPYSGPLPDAILKNDGAFLHICISVGLTVCVSLIVMDGNKERRFSVEVTTQEKNDLLFSFFFVNKGGNAFYTRWDCGLTHYWLGHYQDAYTHWRRFVYEEYGMDGLVRQLSRKALKQIVLYIGEYGEIA